MILEIAVFNIHSAIQAALAGAHRIEVCENNTDGGTTASYGTLKTIKEKIQIPVFPIVRPRGGDFLYTTEEFEVMKKDMLLIKQLGFEGAVTGLLKQDGSIDIERTAILVNMAYPLEITFHRAFDRCKNPLQSLENIIQCGCQRILTSGQQLKAYNGKDLIKQLVIQADDRIIIMPGSGIRADNIREVITYTGVAEIHSSARVVKDSDMQYQVTDMFDANEQNCFVDINEIKQMKKITEAANNL